MITGAIVRRAAVAAGVLVLVLGGGCARAPADPRPHRVVYRLTWAADDVTSGADGSWSVTNDLGYVIHVRRGWITSFGMELVECPKSASTWPSLDLVDTAWAGHSAGAPNPAAIRPMQIESLTEPAGREAGAVTLAAQAYCQLHYLVARAGSDAPGRPAEIDMVDASLHLDGSHRAPGATSDVPFSVHSDVAYGQLFAQRADRTPVHVETGHASVRVEVRRRRARMFDRVDFAVMTPRQAALQILTSLVDAAEITIVPIAANDAGC